MGLVEGQIGKLFPAGAVADFTGGQVESVTTRGLLPSGGCHLGFGGMQPSADLVRDGRVGLFVGGLNHR